MCGLKSYNKLHEKFSESVSTVRGRPLSDDSTIDYLKSLSFSLNFIDTGLKVLESTFACCCHEYQYKMIELFANITTTNPTPKPKDLKKKRQLHLTDIGGE